MEQFVALRDKYGGIGDMVGGRTKVRCIREPENLKPLLTARN